MSTAYSFQFHIADKYFPGYKVTKPFYADVKYQLSSIGKVIVTEIKFFPEIFLIASIGGRNFYNEIYWAAEDHAKWLTTEHKEEAFTDSLNTILQPQEKVS